MRTEIILSSLSSFSRMVLSFDFSLPCSLLQLLACDAFPSKASGRASGLVVAAAAVVVVVIVVVVVVVASTLLQNRGRRGV
jgi:hypothetical protein